LTDAHDPTAIARAIIDANLYMVLGTADQAGRPWVSPVYYAPASYREFLWVSDPEAQHSRNLATRPEISIVIFDSQVPINTGQAVYMGAVAEQLTGPDSELAIDLFSQRGVGHGGRELTLQDVRAPAELRLYRATAVGQFVLDEQDNRVPVTL
jgi:Pyridoxamine 5'-phosphate oxidase